LRLLIKDLKKKKEKDKGTIWGNKRRLKIKIKIKGQYRGTKEGVKWNTVLEHKTIFIGTCKNKY